MILTSTLRATLRSSVTRSGIGLHSGETTTVRLCPAAPGTGRVFIRLDRHDRGAPPTIPATVASVCQTQLSTELVAPNTASDNDPDTAAPARVRTVEHLLAALVAAGVSDVVIELDGAEVPLLDGSAKEWCAAIGEAGVEVVPVAGDHPLPFALTVATPISVYHGDASVTALPSSELRFSYGIAFDEAAIGEQWQSWTPIVSDDPISDDPIQALDDFAQAIGNARTFGLARQVEQLQAAGLIRGGSLDNALVCDGERWLNPPLRFANEPVRHKILDLVGDLSLLGAIPKAHYIAYKASHALHIALARAIDRELS